ncbi:MAG: MraY family glycosyltransferase [Nitrospiraceae bacterium]
MLSTLFFSFVGSLIICMALIPPLMATASRLQFLDIPTDQRRVHSDPVAKVGGIAFGIGTFAAMLIWAPKDDIVVAGLLGGVTILLFGMWDDRVGLPYTVKFMGQAAGAAIVMWQGDIHVNALPFLESELSLWIAYPLTLLIIVGVTNAVNLADGLDGLAGGLSLLSFAGMACLAYLGGDQTVTLLMVPVLGGLLGFLRFNTYPARIFMGDAGSQFLGFFMAISAIVLTDPLRGPYTPVLGLFLLGLPLLDTVGVMMQRLKEGRSPFVADKNHLHHKLLAMGFTHYEAVLMIYLLQASMVTLAYALRWQSELTILSAYAAVAGLILFPFVQSRLWSLQSHRVLKRFESCFGELSTVLSAPWLVREPIRLLGVAVPAFLVVSVFLPKQVPEDMGSVATALLAVTIVGLWILPTWAPLLVRAALYVGSTFVMYLSEPPVETVMLLSPIHAFFLLLAILVALTIRFNSEHRFQTTPLDYLMVFLAIMIPALPEMHVVDISLSFLTAKLIVLFFRLSCCCMCSRNG